MGHFAKVVNGIVTNVIVAEPEFFETFVDSSPGSWIQTSYTSRGGNRINPDTGDIVTIGDHLRYNYAGIGYTYNSESDAFIPPKPYNSWILDEETFLWNPPISAPEDGNRYIWSEETLSWEQIENG